jgi:hypothetical protein
VGPFPDGQGGWEKSQGGSHILRFYCRLCTALAFRQLTPGEAEAAGWEVAARPDGPNDEDDDDEEEDSRPAM